MSVLSLANLQARNRIKPGAGCSCVGVGRKTIVFRYVQGGNRWCRTDVISIPVRPRAPVELLKEVPIL
jgi:hypothetical protein